MESKVEKEVALNDLTTFVNKWRKKPLETTDVEEMYPDVLEAIMDGFVVFNDDQVPTYTLKHPILDDKQQPAVTVINFKTRIKPSVLAEIAKGLHPQKDLLMLQLRITANIIGQTTGMIDRFEPYDYDAISQIATVFS